MNILISKILIIVASLMIAANSYAIPYVVDAKSNSSSGGSGLSTIFLTIGQNFSVDVNPSDLWNAGALPRWSNADGLTSNLFATGSDDSGQAAGTKIGQSFAFWTQHGLTAPYGSLVGEIDNHYFLIGTHFSGPAAKTGTLELYYWDANSGDNTESITANVTSTPVPEPSTFAFLGAGLVGAALIRRRIKM